MEATGREGGTRSCLFCGATGKLTKEHVWPQWLRQLVDATPVAHVLETQKGIERIWDAPPASMTVRRICSNCNNGWMSQMERNVRPLLVGMVRGHAKALTSDDQRILATWGVKTAMVMDSTAAQPKIPPEHRAWLFNHRLPPRDTVVLLARYAGERYPLFGTQRSNTLQVSVGKQAPRDQPTYLVTVTIGSVVLQVWGHFMTNVGQLRPHGWKADFAQAIWPDSGVFAWPLPRALGDDGLRRFADGH